MIHPSGLSVNYIILGTFQLTLSRPTASLIRQKLIYLTFEELLVSEVYTFVKSFDFLTFFLLIPVRFWIQFHLQFSNSFISSAHSIAFITKLSAKGSHDRFLLKRRVPDFLSNEQKLRESYRFFKNVTNITEAVRKRNSY